MSVIKGELYLDHRRGVIYFNDDRGQCVLRICRLPPIPRLKRERSGFWARMLDITHMRGCDWGPPATEVRNGTTFGNYLESGGSEPRQSS